MDLGPHERGGIVEEAPGQGVVALHEEGAGEGLELFVCVCVCVCGLAWVGIKCVLCMHVVRMGWYGGEFWGWG
jgi:hypothetical protein